MSIKAKILLMALTMAVLTGVFGIFFLENYYPEQHREIENTVPIFLFFLLSMWFIASYLIFRWLTPITQLTVFTKEVTQSGDYNKRIKISSDIHITNLADNLNSLLETISNEIVRNKESNAALKDAQKDIGRLARFDSVTQLPNRHYFMETMERALYKAQRDRKRIAIMFFAVDGIKLINNSHGHGIGDRLLQEVAKRTQMTMRKGDLVASLGGEEFVILLNSEPDEVLLNDIASRLAKILISPYEIDKHTFNINVNIGIATSDSADYEIADMLSNADIAMYVSKLNGPGNYAIFAPHMKQNKRRRLEIANCLVDGFEKDEFHLVYQTKISKSLEVKGFEALLRWHSDVMGPIAPAEFIPIAEQSGMIFKLTQWVVEKVLSDMKTIINATNNDIKVSVNLSAYDISNSKLSSAITNLMDKYRVSGRNLEFELTESAYLENFDTANEFIKRMRERGCTIAIDDFGTGYSSLSYLTQIQIDTLKVDKQFIENMLDSSKSMVITKTIVTLAKQLGHTVCAEGAEKEAQVKSLFDMGCDQIQGFYFSVPRRLNYILAEFSSKVEKTGS